MFARVSKYEYLNPAQFVYGMRVIVVVDHGVVIRFRPSVISERFGTIVFDPVMKKAFKIAQRLFGQNAYCVLSEGVYRTS